MKPKETIYSLALGLNGDKVITLKCTESQDWFVYSGYKRNLSVELQIFVGEKFFEANPAGLIARVPPHHIKLADTEVRQLSSFLNQHLDRIDYPGENEAP